MIEWININIYKERVCHWKLELVSLGSGKISSQKDRLVSFTYSLLPVSSLVISYPQEWDGLPPHWLKFVFANVTSVWLLNWLAYEEGDPDTQEQCPIKSPLQVENSVHFDHNLAVSVANLHWFTSGTICCNLNCTSHYKNLTWFLHCFYVYQSLWKIQTHS